MLPTDDVKNMTTNELEAYYRSLSSKLLEAKLEDLETMIASRFSVFEYIQPDENRLSDIIADLLRPSGHHAQGDRFLRAFYEVADINPHLRSTDSVYVIREAPCTHISNCKRRMDILVVSSAGALMIENKADPIEQEDQFGNYCSHLQQRYQDNYAALFLTPDGAKPTTIEASLLQILEMQGRFRALSYVRDLRRWLLECVRECKSDRIRWFLRDFDRYIEEHF